LYFGTNDEEKSLTFLWNEFKKGVIRQENHGDNSSGKSGSTLSDQESCGLGHDDLSGAEMMQLFAH
jgi:hypothetical protein